MSSSSQLTWVCPEEATHSSGLGNRDATVDPDIKAFFENERTYSSTGHISGSVFGFRAAQSLKTCLRSLAETGNAAQHNDLDKALSNIIYWNGICATNLTKTLGIFSLMVS